MDATCLIRLARHVRRFDPDVIHATLFHANLAARWVGRLDRPRPIITATVTIEIERPLHRVLEALTGALSDLHVANSTAVAEHLVAELGMEESRITVVPNGIDLDEIAFAPALSRADMGLSDRCPLIVWAGRMDPVKDLETFVDVIGRIRARSDVQAVLLGDGPMKGQVAKAIASRRLDDVIFLRGWTQELPRWLKSADVLLFPSLTEGCPNVVLEAMACGCPLSRPTFQLRVIRDGVDGFLCAPERCSEFADRVMQVINDRARAEKWRHPSGQFCKVRPFLRR
jgi:glycosyltransferase involved in cell wall biosynthesis